MKKKMTGGAYINSISTSLDNRQGWLNAFEQRIKSQPDNLIELHQELTQKQQEFEQFYTKLEGESKKRSNNEQLKSLLVRASELKEKHTVLLKRVNKMLVSPPPVKITSVPLFEKDIQKSLKSTYDKQTKRRWWLTAGLIGIGLAVLPVLPIMAGIVAYLWTIGKRNEPVQKLNGQYMLKELKAAEEIRLQGLREHVLQQAKQLIVTNQDQDKSVKKDTDKMSRKPPVTVAGEPYIKGDSQIPTKTTSQLKERHKSAHF